jgi:ribosomal protein L11 methyltransferase
MSDEAPASWLQLTLTATKHTPEQLEAALLAAGALSVALQAAGDQPLWEPAPGETPLWSQTQVSGLFAAQTDFQAVQHVLRSVLGSELPGYHLEVLVERDWTRAWLEDFHPMRFGKRLWVYPTETAPPDDPQAVTLRLDPGLAFGTGTHPTTSLCLEWLDGTQLEAKTAIDYGCGSGILAIAAAKLGASRVWAVDIDPQALLASERNAERNHVREPIVLGTPDYLIIPPVDILLANILAAPLIRLAPRFSTLVRNKGQLVLSGILETQAAEVQKAFKPWFSFGPSRYREDWVLLQAVRKD